jgi:hypothetical protein
VACYHPSPLFASSSSHNIFFFALRYVHFSKSPLRHDVVESVHIQNLLMIIAPRFSYIVRQVRPSSSTMSRESRSSQRNRIYGPPSGQEHDRHIQNIIDHASNLFPDIHHRLPQLCTPTTTDENRDKHTDAFGQPSDEAHEYRGLDDLGTLIILVLLTKLDQTTDWLPNSVSP